MAEQENQNQPNMEKFLYPDGQSSEEPGKNPSQAVEPPVEPSKEEWSPNPLWEDLKAVEGFKMPENVSKENEEELLKQALVDNGLAEPVKDESKEPPKINDPEYAAYLEWKKTNPEGSLEQFVEARTKVNNLLKLDGREFMKQSLLDEYGLFDEKNNPFGLTEEQIDEFITKMEDDKTLALEVQKRKRAMATKQSETPAAQQDPNKLVEEAAKFTEKFNDEVDLGGIKLSKAEVAEVNEAFKKAFVPGDDGVPPIVKMMYDDDNVWKFFAFNFVGEQKLKEKMFNAKESTKDQIFNKLGLKPRVSGKQAAPANKNVITPSKWATPELPQQ